MERGAISTKKEMVSQRNRLSPEMAFVAIVDTAMPEDVDNLEWQQRGACTIQNANGFYPGRGETIRDVKKICNSCKVADICLDYALAHNEEYGVWGGLSVRERRKLLRAASRV